MAIKATISKISLKASLKNMEIGGERVHQKSIKMFAKIVNREVIKNPILMN